jgi:NADPH2:quinone reductase
METTTTTTTEPLRSYLPEGTMSAMVFDDYGDPSVLHAAQLPRPERLPGQAVVQVVASGVNPIDYRLRRGEMKWLLPGGFPRVPGYDVAGYVVDCAADSGFAVGDRVMAFLDNTRGGASAEFVTCSLDVIAKLPQDMPFEEAAAIPLAGTTALQSLRDHGRMRPNDRVLVNGASGGVGMFAVQIAKAFGCHVDAVASAANEAFCKSLGVDQFIDYRKSDFTQTGQQWDLIFDAAGKSSYFAARKVMKAGGRFVSTEPDLHGLAMSMLTWPLSKTGRVMLAKPKRRDLETLIELYQDGTLKVTIDRKYPFSELAEAHRRVETGVDHGKVVVVHDGS